MLPVISDTPYWTLYSNNYEIIDQIFKTKYYNFVIPSISEPTEVDYPTSDIIFTELTLNSNQFLQSVTTALNKLWELESIEFSPVENYDRHEKSTVTKTGTEKITDTENGSIVDIDIHSGVDTIERNNTGSVKVTNSGTNTTTDTSSETSYSTNLVDTNVSEFTDNTSRTTDYNDVKEVVTDSKGAKLEHTKTANAYTTESEHAYDNVKEDTDTHIYGNIGVTTATSMMKEYTDFYTTYNFWVKMWDMYVNMFASVLFDTDRKLYE